MCSLRVFTSCYKRSGYDPWIDFIGDNGGQPSTLVTKRVTNLSLQNPAGFPYSLYSLTVWKRYARQGNTIIYSQDKDKRGAYRFSFISALYGFILHVVK